MITLQNDFKRFDGSLTNNQPLLPNLENLKYRLACHFKEQNHQIIKNEKLFLKWFKNANEDDNYSDEKYSYLFNQDNFAIFLLSVLTTIL